MREAPGMAESKDPYVLQAQLTTSFDAIISAMRTTVALDDDLVRIAQEFTGVTEKTALIREAPGVPHSCAFFAQEWEPHCSHNGLCLFTPRVPQMSVGTIRI